MEALYPQTPRRPLHKMHPLMRREHRTKRTPRTRKMVFDDIPEPVIYRILEFYCTANGRRAILIRLVNKKLATMALPALMHTIDIGSGATLAHLVRVEFSPLYYDPWVSFVRCLQFSFAPDRYVLLHTIHGLPLVLPNLQTVRFKYSQGVCIRERDSDDNTKALLATHSLLRAANARSNSTWFMYLSKLRPHRFEWISDDSCHLHLVSTPAKWRLLFETWAPSRVFFDGICPVQQSDLSTWAPLFLGKRTHIRGSFHTSHFYFLAGFPQLRPGCELLVLEKGSSGTTGSLAKGTSTLIFGTMLIQLRNWTNEDRDALKLILTGKIPVRPLVCEIPDTPVLTNPTTPSRGRIMHLVDLAIALGGIMLLIVVLPMFYIMGGRLHSQRSNGVRQIVAKWPNEA